MLIDMSSVWGNIKLVENLVSEEDFALLSKYRARSKYVRGLTLSKVQGMSLNVSEGYFVMLKLSLAFSAVEMISKVTHRSNNLGICDKSVVSALNNGRFDKLLMAIDKDNLRRYPKSESNQVGKWKNLHPQRDLTPFVVQCRNFMLHGSFSPSESGLSSSSSLRGMILGLAEASLEAGDMALEKWALKLLKSPTK